MKLNPVNTPTQSSVQDTVSFSAVRSLLHYLDGCIFEYTALHPAALLGEEGAVKNAQQHVQRRGPANGRCSRRRFKGALDTGQCEVSREGSSQHTETTHITCLAHSAVPGVYRSAAADAGPAVPVQGAA